MSKISTLLAGVAFFSLFTVVAGAGQSDLVANTAIDGPVLKFDWPDIEIGIGSYEEGPTGVTVIRFAKRASLAIDVRGGSPGTVNTDVLRLAYSLPMWDAVVLSGGSAYGEETVTAVATGLKDNGERSAKLSNLANVTGAIIYDFTLRFNEIYPDKRLAQAALHALRGGVFPLGAQGAGRMATQGSFLGCYAHSGQGAAFRQLGQTKIAAFVVVNALGAVTDRAGNLVKCQRAKSWGAVTKISEFLQHLPDSLSPEWSEPAAKTPIDAPRDKNTTIGLVVTNEALDYAALQRLAVQVHTSMARAIQPFSTQFDGDVLFSASTQEVHGNPKLNSQPGGLSPTLGAIAAETMWDAILASVPKEQAFVASSATVAPNVLEAYAGEYVFGPDARLSVKVDHDRLLIQSMGEGPIFEFVKNAPVPVLPMSETDFYVDGRYHTHIEFIKDSQGRVSGAVLNPGRWAQKGKKSSE